ncbi:MAG TPA: shikimate dehydrogenase [Candidatus Eremiobacteraeota bacterium]|nr:MAG: Long-chain acyl-(acyl-carrier-protein) reductase [bacterium ADurb.Bin363]HPZ09121.1 shikimate dehydrogenase [Candidatus Eremiobacteraeota bacterium]
MEKFAFIIHPIDIKDVIRVEPKAANKRLELIEKMLEWMPPHKASHITGIKSHTGMEAEGWFITCPLFPKQFIELPRKQIYKKIIETGKIAKKLGARILGLGAYTSVIGDAGETVAKNLDIPVTTGNSLTIAIAIEGALEAAKFMHIDVNKCNTSVIGATGSIGSVCSYILADKVGHLTLVARSLKRMQKIVDFIKENKKVKVFYSTDLQDTVNKSDIVISATTSIHGIILPAYPKSGSVICDVALPHDVSREMATIRTDVLVIEGGLVEVPGSVDFGYDFGYPPGIALACMAETIILALEKRYECFSLGRKISIEKVEEIYKLAKKHGFKLAGLRCFERSISQKEIDEIYERACKMKRS